MIEILGKIPRKIGLAYSAGVDSVAIHDFLSNNHEIDLLHFNHGETDPYADVCEDFTTRVAQKYGQNLVIGRNNKQIGKGQSLECFWRDCRYEWLHSLPYDFIVVCHHLDDAMETWVWSCLNGSPRTIPYQRNDNVYRPFLLNKKSEFVNWAKRKNLAWFEDPSNKELSKTRNKIRHDLIPVCMEVNVGLHSVVKDKVYADYYGKKKKCKCGKNQLTCDIC